MTTAAPPAAVAPTSTNFFASVLALLKLPVTQPNLDALYAVEHLEGPNSGYNPINVVQHEPGSHVRINADGTPNSADVQDFASFDTGVQGTATLLQGSTWAGVRAALAQGNSTPNVLDAFRSAYATWGSHVNFTDNASINAQEASRNVGQNPGSGALAGASALFNGTGGVVQAISIPGVPDPASIATSVLKPVFNFALNAVFIGAGVGLVILGFWKVASPVREDAKQGVDELAPLAMAAA